MLQSDLLGPDTLPLLLVASGLIVSILEALAPGVSHDFRLRAENGDGDSNYVTASATAKSGGGGGTDYSDDFGDGDISDWSSTGGTWGTSSGAVQHTQNAGGYPTLYYNNGTAWVDYTYSFTMSTTADDDVMGGVMYYTDANNYLSGTSFAGAGSDVDDIAGGLTFIDENGNRLVDVRADPTPRHRLEGLVSYSTDEGAGAEIAWTRRNLFGQAELLTLAGTFAQLERSVSAEYDVRPLVYEAGDSRVVYANGADVEIEAKEILKMRERLNRVFAEQTGQPLEKIVDDTHRNFWLDAEEAVEYGLVGRIIQRRDEVS